jgi:DNA-binding transcriptional regulator YhcF (GntR family)
MLLRLDPADGTPLHEQIEAGLRAAVLDGRVADGERLPAARRLAEALGVNVHTVLRAYATLRDEGLIELRRGRGAIVRAGARERRRAAVAALARRYVEEARRNGFDDREVLAMVKEAL